MVVCDEPEQVGQRWGGVVQDPVRVAPRGVNRRQECGEGGEVVDGDDRHEGLVPAGQGEHAPSEQVEHGAGEPEVLRRLAGAGVSDDGRGVHDAQRHLQCCGVRVHDGVALGLGGLVGAEAPVLGPDALRRPRDGRRVLAADPVPGQVHQPHEPRQSGSESHDASGGVDVGGPRFSDRHAKPVRTGHGVDLRGHRPVACWPCEVVAVEIRQDDVRQRGGAVLLQPVHEPAARGVAADDSGGGHRLVEQLPHQPSTDEAGRSEDDGGASGRRGLGVWGARVIRHGRPPARRGTGRGG